MQAFAVLYNSWWHAVNNAAKASLGSSLTEVVSANKCYVTWSVILPETHLRRIGDSLQGDTCEFLIQEVLFTLLTLEPKTIHTQILKRK